MTTAAERKKARDQAYYIKNREKIIARSLEHQRVNPESARARKTKWRQNNPEKQKAAQDNWHENNPGAKAEWRKDAAKKRQADGQMPYSTEYLRLNRAKAMFYAAQYRSKKKGLEFTIEMSDIVIPERCPVFGMVLSISADKGRSDASPSVDRKDNSKGYTPDNIIIVSWLANRLKNDATPDQLRKVADFYDQV